MTGPTTSSCGVCTRSVRVRRSTSSRFRLGSPAMLTSLPSSGLRSRRSRSSHVGRGALRSSCSPTPSRMRPYWFWFATHQTRFLYAAVVIAIVLGAAALGAVRGVAGLAAAAVLALVIGLAAQHKTNAFNLHPRAAADSWLDTPKGPVRARPRIAIGLPASVLRLPGRRRRRARSATPPRRRCALGTSARIPRTRARTSSSRSR